IPAREYFVLNPLARGRFGADQNDRYACVLKLFFDPVLNGRVTFFLDGFPLCRVNEASSVLSGDDVRVSDLSGAPRVAFVVEAEKYSPGHKMLLSEDVCGLL